MKNSKGTWYVEKGRVRFDYTGTYEEKGIVYPIKNGKVIATAAEIDYANVYFDYSEEIDAQMAAVATKPIAADIQDETITVVMADDTEYVIHTVNELRWWRDNV